MGKRGIKGERGGLRLRHTSPGWSHCTHWSLVSSLPSCWHGAQTPGALTLLEGRHGAIWLLRAISIASAL